MEKDILKNDDIKFEKKFNEKFKEAYRVNPKKDFKIYGIMYTRIRL